MTTKATISKRASTPSSSSIDQEQLGPLAELPGTWFGKGLNVIALPDKHENKKFRLMVNATQETLTFNTTGPIPNRGNLQDDITFFGLHYLQQVSDAVTSEHLHLEPGLWLNLPGTTAPLVGPTVARLSTIPHGDVLLAQGDFFTVEGGPQISLTDQSDPTASVFPMSHPFTLDKKGNRINDTSEQYLAPYSATPDPPLPPWISAGSIDNPNLVLVDAIKGQDITETVVLFVNATPIAGINGTPIVPPSTPDNESGVLNIPFVVANANANSVSAIFWIETVQNNGKQFMQLQYTQTVILDFPVLGPDGKNMVDIKWPHISVATLVKR